MSAIVMFVFHPLMIPHPTGSTGWKLWVILCNECDHLSTGGIKIRPKMTIKNKKHAINACSSA